MSPAAMGGLQSGWMPRLRRFIARSWPERIRAVGLQARALYPKLPIPARISSDLWFLAWQNDLGDHVLLGNYEEPELAFVRQFVRPGMVVLDIGANEGFYTLFFARCVGVNGTVISFEPSQRERRRLRINLWINFIKNVRVEEFALSAQEGEMSFYVVETGETGCNSLRPPAVKGSTRPVSVTSTTLDLYLRRNSLPRIDFMKIDVEGAEWSVLQGAVTALRAAPRPFMMIEVSDLRTRPWGYHSQEIAKCLRNLDYELFRPLSFGKLEPMDVMDIKDGSDFNVIAAPKERSPEIASFLVDRETEDRFRSEVIAGSRTGS
jgi:FkbM family methyltransferase